MVQQHSLQATDPLHLHLLHLAGGHLAQRSVASYNSKFRSFLAFCQEQGLQPVPASARTLMLYVAWLHKRGTVAPKSYKQYLAVINTVHADMGLSRPGLAAPLLNGLIKSAKRSAVASGDVKSHRAPIPAKVATQALAAVFRPGCPPPMVLSIAAFLIAFHTGLRGASVLQLRAADVLLSQHAYTVSVFDEKGRAHEGQRRPIPCSCKFPQLLALITAVVRAAPAPTSILFARLGASEGAFCATVLRVLRYIHVTPPAGEQYLGHSCRSGMASACAKLGVPIWPTIAERGGWHSDAVLLYISSAVPDDYHNFEFFSFLLPAAVAAAAAQVHVPVPLFGV